MIAYLVSHLMCSSNLANSADYKSNSMDSLLKLLILDERVVAHQNSLLNCFADLEVSGFLMAQIYQDLVVIFYFDRDVTVLV